MVDKHSRSTSRRPGFIAALIALVIGVAVLSLGVGAVVLFQRLYRQNQQEQALNEQLRSAERAADMGRQLLSRNDLPGAAREFLSAYEQGLRDTSVRFLLPWLLSRLDLLVATLPHDKEVSAVAFSPDGRFALTGSHDHSARIFEVKSGRLLQRFRGHGDAVVGAFFSGDGSRVLTLSNDSTCRLWRVATAHSGDSGSSGDGGDAGDKNAIATLAEANLQPWLCSFSPDGTRIVMVAGDKSVILFDGRTGARIATLAGHLSHVLLASFSADSQRLLTAAGKTAYLWDAASGKLLTPLTGHTENVKDAVFSPDSSRIVTTSADQTARLWDGHSGQFLMLLEGHNGTVYSATFTLANGKAIMTISADGTARLWDSQTGRPLFLPVGHPRYSQLMALSKDGSRMVTLNESGTLELWDRILGHMRASLSVGGAEANGEATPNPGKDAGAKIPVAFSPNGRRIVTGGPDGIARIWDGRTGQILVALKGHHSRVSAVAWSPDSSLVLTGSADGTARIFRSHIERLPLPIEGHQSEVSSIAWSPDSKRLLTASRDGTARIWDTTSGQQLLAIDGPRRPIDNAFFAAKGSGDGERVVTVVTGGNGSAGRTPCIVRVIDARSGEVRASFGEKLDLGRALAVSPTGDRVLTVSSLPEGDNRAQLYELNGTDARLLQNLDGHTATVASASFSPDGKLLATASDDHTVRIWDGKSGQFARLLDGHEQGVRSLAFAPDSRRLLTGSADHTARLFDAVSATSLSTFGGQIGSVRGVYFSPDGERALTVDGGERAWLWNTREGRLVAALMIYRASNKGHIATVFSPDSTRVASVGDELRIYEGKTGVSLFRLDDDDHAEVFTAAAFSPDGTLLATGTQSGAVKLWDVHLESRPPVQVAAELASILERQK